MDPTSRPSPKKVGLEDWTSSGVDAVVATQRAGESHLAASGVVLRYR